MRSLSFVLVLGSLTLHSLSGIAAPVPPKGPDAQIPPAESSPQQESIDSQLAILIQGKEAVEQDRRGLKEKETTLDSMRTGKGRPAKATAEEIAEMQKDIDATRLALEQHENELRQAIVGVTGLEENQEIEQSGDLTQDFKEVLQPLLRSAKGLVAAQRRSAQIEWEINRKQALVKKIDEAMANLDNVREAALKVPGNKDLSDLLVDERKQLETRRAHLPVEIGNLQREHDALEAERKPWSEYATALLRDSIMRRIWNLLLLGLVVTVVLLGFRMAHRFMTRRGWLRRLGVNIFILRLGRVFYYFASVLTASMAGFLVLYASNDWFLLTLAMLALVGLLLAGRHTLPKLYEQVKLLLNVGSTREGERVIYRDLPWLVKRINFFCDLTNPSLTGGNLRLSLREVIPLNSRAFERKERWFPTEEGDWVIMEDGLLGKVVMQTPEYVQLVPNGGSYKTYLTPDFLKRNPRNLSHNFRIQSTFGLAYAHAQAAQSEIPSQLEIRLRKDLSNLLDMEEILHLKVTIAKAAPSSIDLLVILDCRGTAAPHYQELDRLIQASCIAEAMAKNWEIPFPQLTVHAVR